MKPELILPAGDLDKLRIAYQYGGDTAYIGLPMFSMRARENQFNEEFLYQARALATELGKKLYVTTNIFPRNYKVDVFKQHFKQLAELKPDAIIAADPGVISMIKEFYPDAKIHLSVQANSMNYATVKFWKEQGVARAILPRELTIPEIKEIHEAVPDIELECFVHGAICMAFSGRCLLSQYMNVRDPNQGNCAHSCRWKYKVLEETERPGEYMPIEEDSEGTYIMNSKDLCALPFLEELRDAGVSGFKIEGRSKTIHYLSTVAKVYRKAIDDMCAGKPYDPSLMEVINRTANRSFIPGYLKREFDEESIYYSANAPVSEYQFVGVVRNQGGLDKQEGLYEVELKNRVLKGHEVEVMTPEDMFTQELQEIYNENFESVDVAHGGHKNVFIKIDKAIPVGSILRQKRK